MRDVLPDLAAFAARGERVGRAVVTSVFNSAPRPEGSVMLRSERGSIAGGVSGGCVEGATAVEIEEAMTAGRSNLVTFGVSDETAWSVGLACGGTIRVLVQPAVPADVLAAATGPGGVVVATVLGGPEGATGTLVVRDDGTTGDGSGAAGTMEGPPAGAALSVRGAIVAAARAALAREASATVDLPLPGGGVLAVFLEAFTRQPRLVIFGGVHIATALVPLARALGYRTVVADGREAFLTRERFPDADELVVGWPEEAFARIGLDPATYVVILSHDPKFDEPALVVALRSPAAYVGAVGSRTTQADRRARLRSAGLTDAELARLRGPIGLDLGGRQPSETALAILAEMTAARYGGSGRPRSELVESGRDLDEALLEV
ncbi:MAG: hypothetical protein A2X23_04610 [Chloroflexi bacterium GWC2_73_18]|nr:MAG: hypothetical protein A2X23_04610 [Chloroflexi bacterium GWC2_73_18]